jgi:hypothetical protein
VLGQPAYARGIVRDPTPLQEGVDLGGRPPDAGFASSSRIAPQIAARSRAPSACSSSRVRSAVGGGSCRVPIRAGPGTPTPAVARSRLLVRRGRRRNGPAGAPARPRARPPRRGSRRRARRGRTPRAWPRAVTHTGRVGRRPRPAIRSGRVAPAPR